MSIGGRETDLACRVQRRKLGLAALRDWDQGAECPALSALP